jgi:hypothetical protein
MEAFKTRYEKKNQNLSLAMTYQLLVEIVNGSGY